MVNHWVWVVGGVGGHGPDCCIYVFLRVTLYFANIASFT